MGRQGGLSCCSTGSGWRGCSPGGPHLGSGPEHQLHSGARSWEASWLYGRGGGKVRVCKGTLLFPQVHVGTTQSVIANIPAASLL